MIPDPLHPVLVHFPIVLILIGAVVAVTAVFLKRWHLPQIAAVLLALGALGALAAVQTGEEEGEMVFQISEGTESILELHEDWAETTRSLAIVAAILAVVSACLFRFPITSRVFAVVTAMMALAAAYAVAQTGHYGGQLVYQHGVGINVVAGQADAQFVVPRGDRDDH
jgi:uncharacterized membrane protein